MAFGLFTGSLLLLWLLDHLTGFGEEWMGPYRWFSIYHASLLVASAIMSDRLLGGAPPTVMYSLFIAAGAAGVIWAGVLGIQQKGQDQ